MRAIVSFAPPAACGTISVIGFEGYASCAMAIGASTNDTSSAAITIRILGITWSPPIKRSFPFQEAPQLLRP